MAHFLALIARGNAKEQRRSIDQHASDVTVWRFPLRDARVSKHRIPNKLTPGGHVKIVVRQARTNITGRPEAIK